MKKTTTKLLLSVLLTSITLTFSFSQNKENTLAMQKGFWWSTYYYNNGEPISKQSFLSELRKDEFSYREYKNGKALQIIGYIFTFPSAFVLGWELGKVAINEDNNKASLIVGGLGVVAGLTSGIIGQSKINNAIKLYNSKSANLGLKAGGNGFGLVLNF